MNPVDNHNHHQEYVPPTRRERLRWVCTIPPGVLLSCGPSQLVALVALPIIGCKALYNKIKEKSYNREILNIEIPSKDITNVDAIFTDEDKPFFELNGKLLTSQKRLASLKAQGIAFAFALIPFAGMHAGINYFTHRNKPRDEALRLDRLRHQNEQAENSIGLESITL